METVTRIDYQGLNATPLLDRMIEEHVERLRQQCDHIVAVEVTVELQQKELRAGSNYRVRIQTSLENHEGITADYQPGEKEPPVPLPAAVQRAFSQAEQKLAQVLSERRCG